MAAERDFELVNPDSDPRYKELWQHYHGDSALDARHRLQIFPNAKMREDANLLIFPTLDAANIAFNLLKNAAGSGMTVGPILLGAAKPVHILTPSATVRRIINMTALTVVEAGPAGVARVAPATSFLVGRYLLRDALAIPWPEAGR
jgi:phosphotransacetylase